MRFSCDVAIIGGGVIGLACAWRLAQAGAQVQLFERGQIGREASHAAAGMLAAQCEAAVHPPAAAPEYSSAQPGAFFDLCLQSRSLYPDFASELLEETGIDIELCIATAKVQDWREPGILYVSNSGDEIVVENFLAQRAFEQRVEYSDFNGQSALWLPDEGQVENRKLVAALKIACENSGVVLNENQEMQPEDLAGKCDAILLCAGCWSTPGGAKSPISERLVRPVAGEVLAVRPSQRLEKVVYSRDVYLVPRRDGRVLIGATMDERGFDKTISGAAKAQLLQAASALISGAQNWAIEEHWAGLRPASRDGLPILGSTPDDNLFIATGHFRNGILLTPITAQLMADCILNGADLPPEFSMARFEGAGEIPKCDQGKLTSCA